MDEVFGDVRQLRKDAEAAMAAAEHARPDQRKSLLDRAFELREREESAWAAVDCLLASQVGRSVAVAEQAFIMQLRAQDQHEDRQPMLVKVDRVPGTAAGASVTATFDTGASSTGHSTGAFAGIVDLERAYEMTSTAAQSLHSARCGYARALTLCSDSGDSRLDDSPAALAQRDAVRTAIEQLNVYTDAVFVGQKVRVRGLHSEEHNGRTGTCLRRLEPRSPEEVLQPRYAVRLLPAKGKPLREVAVKERNLDRV
jgi:hypothetical protein